jgi:uncharacterized protein YmfQ (DUF2313 family)
MTEVVQDRSLEEQTNNLVSYLPLGRAFEAKSVTGFLRSFFRGLAIETQRIGNKINEVVRQYDVNTTVNFIDEWERAVGIPDECFNETTTITIEQRRFNVKAKLFMRRVYTEEQYYQLINILRPGTDAYIEHRAGFPFRMYLHLPGSLNPFVFPLLLPFQLGGGPGNIIVCALKKCKPAYSEIIPVYDLPG